MNLRPRRYRTVIFVAVFAFLTAILIVKATNTQASSGDPARLNSAVKLSPINGFTGGTTAEIKTDSPLVNFQNGRELNIDRVLDSLRADGVDVSSAEPVSLASDDLNADGFPDLITGFATSRGGLLMIYYGDQRAFAPSSDEDLRNVFENRYRVPFSQVSAIKLEFAPDLLFTGDFDRDSRMDILAAAKDGDALNFLISDSNYQFEKIVRQPLSGRITAMTVGQKTLPDGYADIVVATDESTLLVYESSASVLDQVPDVFPVRAETVRLGRLDDDSAMDIAVISDGRISILHGGDGLVAENVDLTFPVKTLEIADFIWDRDSRMEMAVASPDGSVKILSRGTLDTRPLTTDELRGRRQLAADIRDGKRPAKDGKISNSGEATLWETAEETTVKTSFTAAGGSPVLTPMLASGRQSMDLLTLNTEEKGLTISGRNDALTQPETERNTRTEVSFATAAEPVAVLPMRLNIHARPSLVILENGSLKPTVMFVAPEATFTVSKAADTNDGTCNADCSLREAIVAANAAAGLDTINFAAGLNGLAIQLTRVGDDNTAVNGDLDINSDITITGNGAANTLLQGSNNASFTSNMGDKFFGINQDGALTAQSVAISNLTVRFTRNDILPNGLFTQTGGATDIFLTGTGAMPGPTTTLTNVTYDSNASLHAYGGAINIDSGSLTPPTSNVFRGTVQVTGSTISNNDTLSTSSSDNPPAGGGINMFGDLHNVTVSSSTINANQTSADFRSNGGGINVRHSNGGTVTINNGTNITNNIAGSDGGGILTVFVQTFSMTGGSISGNTAQGSSVNSGATESADGGGFFNGSNIGAPSTLSGVTISNNIATAGASARGGGIEDGANSALNITNCTISGNSSDTGGGVITTNAGGTQTTTITNGTITGNTATNGAGVAVTSGIMNVTGGSVSTNAAVTNGGGSYATGGTLTFDGTTISGNTATNGSGINAAGGNTALSNTVDITNNILIAGGTLTGNTGNTTNLTGNYLQTSGTFTGNNSTINISGPFTHSGGTFTAGTGTFNFNGTGAQSIANSGVITFHNLTDSNTTTQLNINNSIGISGILTANGPNTIIHPVSGSVVIGAGAGTLTGTGTIHVLRAVGTNDFFSQYNVATRTLTNLFVDYIGTSLQGVSGATYSNVRLNNASGANLSANATVNGTLFLTAGALNVQSNQLTIDNGITVGTGSFLSNFDGTIIYNQASNGQDILAANYGNLTFSNFNKDLPPTAFGIAGTFTPGTATGHTIAGNTINFNGGITQTIPAFNYTNLTSTNAGARTLASSGTIGVAGTFTPGTNSYTITGSTIDFNGSGSQTIPAFNYNNLTSSSTGGRTLANSGTIGIAGVFTPGTNAYTTTGSTVAFNGAVAQTIPALTFNNLTTNNPAGTTLAGNVLVEGTLTMTNGNIGTGANTLTIATGATANRTAGVVIGNVRKDFVLGNIAPEAPQAVFVFPVGTVTGYSPVTANASGTSTGSLTVAALDGTAPATPAMTPATTLNRYWLLAETGDITADLTFAYLQTDVDVGTEANYRLVRSTAGQPSRGIANVAPCPGAGSICVDTTANTIFAAGVTSFDSFWTAGAILAPTAANASISGRVTSADGRSLGRVRVVVTDTEGNARTTLTSAFGYYSVEGLLVGQTYVVSAQTKQYTFTPRTISLDEDAVGIDLTAEP